MLLRALNARYAKSRECLLALIGQVDATRVLHVAVVVYEHGISVYHEDLVVAAGESCYRGETQLVLENNLEVGEEVGPLLVVPVVSVVGTDHCVVRGLGGELPGVHVWEGRDKLWEAGYVLSGEGRGEVEATAGILRVVLRQHGDPGVPLEVVSESRLRGVVVPAVVPVVAVPREEVLAGHALPLVSRGAAVGGFGCRGPLRREGRL